MTWRLAKSLEVLRSQINTRWPARKIDWDGTIGDAAHSARTSDHNPNSAGVVCAMDITNDPVHGPVSHDLAETLRLSKDPRIKYIISDRRICSSLVQPWVWRPYNGANPHDHHVHVSVGPEASKYDAIEPWTIETSPLQQEFEMATTTLVPTTGTQTAVWLNWFAGLGTMLAGLIDPAFIMNVLGSKFGWLAPFIMLIVNAIAHGTTGNAPTGVAPGVITPAPMPLSDVAKGSIG